MSNKSPSHAEITNCGYYLLILASELKARFWRDIPIIFKKFYHPQYTNALLAPPNHDKDEVGWERKLLLDQAGREGLAHFCSQAIKDEFKALSALKEPTEVLAWLESQERFAMPASRFWLKNHTLKRRQIQRLIDADWYQITLSHFERLSKRPEEESYYVMMDFDRSVMGGVIFTGHCLLAYGSYLSGRSGDFARGAKSKIESMQKASNQLKKKIVPEIFDFLGSREMGIVSSKLKRDIEKFSALLDEFNWNELKPLSTRKDPFLGGRVLCQKLCEAYLQLDEEPIVSEINTLCTIDIVYPHVDGDTVRELVTETKERYRKVKNTDKSIAQMLYSMDILGKRTPKN